MELSENEKAILRDSVERRLAADQAFRAAQEEVTQAGATFQAVLNTIVRLRGLDPERHQLRYDLNKDVWELSAMGLPSPVQASLGRATANGEGPGDITAALGLLREGQKLELPDAPD